MTPVHPRARGEQRCPGSPGREAIGSSPRTRGTDTGAGRPPLSSRFIPAHAGNRCTRPSWVPPTPVHPRARGEQQGAQVRTPEYSGSSPRTRGTGVEGQDAGRIQRFIPAHAGNRAPFPTSQVPATVHPRARGEQARVAQVVPGATGSSPRTRGTAAVQQHGVRPHRFIPAHAGNSRRPTCGLWRASVHPRARGEQLRMAAAVSLSAGSSPRTRGTDSRMPTPSPWPRFIPAHAGNRCKSRGPTMPAAVHPRARGEQGEREVMVIWPNGSSPRTRGTEPHLQHRRQLRRFIPAHAGNRLHLTY